MNREPRSSSVTVRRLVAADAALFMAVRLQALAEEPRAFGRAVEEEARSPATQYRFDEPFAIFGGFSGVDLVAIAGFERLPYVKLRHKAMLGSMYVRPEFRGSGVAVQLVERLIAHARSEGVLQMRLSVADWNERAIAFYAKLGFVEYGREPRALLVDGEFVDERMLVRMLDQP